LAEQVSGVYLTQVSLLLIGQQHLVDFFRYRALLPMTTNTAPTTLSVIQAASQSTFIQDQLYSIVIIKNDKNKRLTIIKPTQTDINRNT
jgi:hypothetical protein